MSRFTLLVVCLLDDRTWHHQISDIGVRVCPRLYYPHQLKGSCVNGDDLVMYNTAAKLRPVTNASVVWHSGLTDGDSQQLEQPRQRAQCTMHPPRALVYWSTDEHRAGHNIQHTNNDIQTNVNFHLCQPTHNLNYMLQPGTSPTHRKLAQRPYRRYTTKKDKEIQG